MMGLPPSRVARTAPGVVPMGPHHARPAPSPDGPFPYAFGRYRLLQHLGRGGMADAYLALDTRLEKNVAVKVPRLAREEYLREARAAARLDHPNFCRVLDCDHIDGVPCLAMEYVQGRRLPVRPLRP